MNPEHLFLGSHAENMADKAAKRRAPRTGAKLTDEDARVIRCLHSLKVSGAWVSRLYGVSDTTVKKIALGLRYRGEACEGRGARNDAPRQMQATWAEPDPFKEPFVT